MYRSGSKLWVGVFVLVALLAPACSHDTPRTDAAPASTAAAAATPTAEVPIGPEDVAPPTSETGGFDGAKAYEFTAKVVEFGPRPPTSDALHKTQDYIRAQLQSFGCAIDEDDFHASTPIGSLAMKNIVAKVQGEGKGIILLLTHYDTLRMDRFVGAVDGGSSTGLMLEMARLLCSASVKKQPSSVWIAFLDGEEALVDWHKDNDNTYGSRQFAARLATSGELKRIHAVILADLIGPKNPRFRRDSNSTRWLTDLVWKTAARLGYREIFVSDELAVEDDHLAFLNRGVAAVDIIDLNDYSYWHTLDDTLDKVSPRTLGIAGHVILESVNELQKKFH
ncbi:MAG TPA: M28 family peptidase [Candidatus Limnocylindria bacterium]|nr:M28 family peptidase [Candidatus Limnocylindria bacterium]